VVHYNRRAWVCQAPILSTCAHQDAAGSCPQISHYHIIAPLGPIKKDWGTNPEDCTKLSAVSPSAKTICASITRIGRTNLCNPTDSLFYCRKSLCCNYEKFLIYFGKIRDWKIQELFFLIMIPEINR